MKNQQWVLRRRPVGDIQSGDLELVERDLPALREGEILVRNIYLSLDPTNRTWMSDVDQYMPPVNVGEVMRGGTMGVVGRESRSSQFKVGDIVNPALGWQSYAVTPEAAARKVNRVPGLPLTALMSVLGGTGITAYYGMLDIAKPKAGETVVVTGAAGAVGSIAGQLAKHAGARVIGIAGGPAKCKWLTDELGFDGAIDCKNEDVGKALDRLCPNGIDVDFENVGGDIMDAVLGRMNLHSRMALCGLISQYNAAGMVPGPSHFSRILMKRINVQGFIVIDFWSRANEALLLLSKLVAEGKLKWKVHIEDGLEKAADAVKLLFNGQHDGKLLIRVSPEP